MKKRNFVLLMISIFTLSIILSSCGGFEAWFEVEFEFPTIEFVLGSSDSSTNEISLSDDERLLELGPYEVNMGEDAENQLGGRPITNMELEINWEITGLTDSIHVKVYIANEEKDVSELTNDELFWEGDLESGEASSTLQAENCPALENVIIPILNSESREGNIYVYLIHNYTGTDQVNGSLSITVKRVRVRIF